MGTANCNRMVLIVILALLCSCKMPVDEPPPVKSVFKVVPESGLTTTRFEFDAAQTFRLADEDHPVLIRYDWQGDGIWDQDYTTNARIVHRYLKTGLYTVRMEARNLLGIRDTCSATLLVEQGYSPPYAILSVFPDSANIYTRFIFNAASSYDDEDSSGLLSYRWDFNGDGDWDTGYSSDTVILYQYPEAGRYQPVVEVKDPTNRSSAARKTITVDLLNDSILPQFIYDGGFGTVTDVFSFDASGSGFLGREDKQLTYSWDIRNDGLWEAANLTTPYFQRVIQTEGLVKVKLRVTDDRDLYMDVIDTIQVFPENTPPQANLVAGNRIGNLRTLYFFHCLNSYDRETSMLDLNYQWDVDGDGSWEPEFENLREIHCRYPKAGAYLVRLKVTDDHDVSAYSSDSVFVFNGTHETGLLVDKRNFIAEYYPTVKIGNLWWMQENISIEIISGPQGKPPPLVRKCYNNDKSLCERYGGLYDYKNVRYPVCPAGWRLPTKAEFQEMINQEAPNSLAPLLFGGNSEMHLLMGGYIDMQGKSLGLGTIAQFWLADKSSYGVPYVWYIDSRKGENRAVMTSETYGYSVRCVKSD